MFQATAYSGDKTNDYKQLLKQATALFEDENDEIANLSNASALLNQFLNDVNWVGFYIWKDDELILGPFQGLPACIRIGYGKGVCGTAVKEGRTQRVADVLAYPGHIACDSASRSEIVIPLYAGNTIYGVLDIDSPSTNRFDETDQIHLEKFAKELEEFLK
ncbi:GAF domain-containing protein [Lentibacillus amyloliquefaciens]|uniref:Histidine kinase n=1 Tax=Lentibacillus amyloliquefaciens TaxID=1472767 RepID=A0A0U4F473_9BACI|nr:GAF domain-containing protein [Lentibacillus amyloliquefaciens]ALX48374.1 histidine kinase [Lentibacillus amyloliquefaciens]